MDDSLTATRKEFSMIYPFLRVLHTPLDYTIIIKQSFFSRDSDILVGSNTYQHCVTEKGLILI